MDAAIRNSWVREVLETERDAEYYKTQFIASTLVSLVTMKPEMAIRMNYKLLKSMYPWESIEEPAEAQEPVDPAVARKAAVEKFNQDLASGKIAQVKKEVEGESKGS